MTETPNQIKIIKHDVSFGLLGHDATTVLQAKSLQEKSDWIGLLHKTTDNLIAEQQQQQAALRRYVPPTTVIVQELEPQHPALPSRKEMLTALTSILDMKRPARSREDSKIALATSGKLRPSASSTPPAASSPKIAIERIHYYSPSAQLGLCETIPFNDDSDDEDDFGDDDDDDMESCGDDEDETPMEDVKQFLAPPRALPPPPTKGQPKTAPAPSGTTSAQATAPIKIAPAPSATALGQATSAAKTSPAPSVTASSQAASAKTPPAPKAPPLTAPSSSSRSARVTRHVIPAYKPPPPPPVKQQTPSGQK